MKTRNNPLKVLHVLDHSLPLHSGYAFRSDNIFQAQLRHGLQPVALTSPKHYQSWRGSPTDFEEINGIRYYRAQPITSRLLPFGPVPAVLNALVHRIREVSKIEQPDVIHAHSPVLNALPSLWIGRRMGIPVIYEVRAFWEDAAVDNGGYRSGSWKYVAVQYAESLVCRFAEQITVLCQGIRDDLIRRGIPQDKITIIFNGVNPDEFKVVEADAEYRKIWNLNGRRVVGFVGSFYPYEGLDLLVNAIADLAKFMPNIVLLLVGGGNMETALRTQVHRLKLENKVILTGRIPHDRIPAVYSLIDVLVYPRYSSRLTELVTPLKPLEAMAMGKAVIASDIGGHRELIQHRETGALFPAGDVSALVRTLGSVLDSSEIQQTMTNGAREWVCSTRTWDQTTSPYDNVYLRAMGG